MEKLKFAKGNAKLGKETAILSLPAGHTCIGAKDCLALVNRVTGKLTDGKDSVFRCYAASSENLFRNVREGRWNNYDKLRGKSVAEMSEIILASLPSKVKLVRLHQSGDFFNQDYFDAWLIVARKRSALIFYGYTKALPLWVRRLKAIPSNFHLVASYGGKFDSLIAKHGLRSVKVVGTNPNETPDNEAKRLGLELDHDDTLVWNYNKDFAIALHGTQPAGSLAGKAWQIIKTQGDGGYKADYFGHYKEKERVNA
jgi:hypothetical protein